MTSQRPIPMPTAFVCPIRTKYNEPTDRPGDLEGAICPVCWKPSLLTGRKGATVTRLACGHVVIALEAGEVTIKARLLRGADDMPELLEALARKLAVAAMIAARATTPLAWDVGSVHWHAERAAHSRQQPSASRA